MHQSSLSKHNRVSFESLQQPSWEPQGRLTVLEEKMRYWFTRRCPAALDASISFGTHLSMPAVSLHKFFWCLAAAQPCLANVLLSFVKDLEPHDLAARLMVRGQQHCCLTWLKTKSLAQDASYRKQNHAAAGQRTMESADPSTTRLLAFERGTFSLIDELNGLGEGGIPDLREQLASDNKECSEKIKRLLHQHYRAFISASKVSKSHCFAFSRFYCSHSERLSPVKLIS